MRSPCILFSGALPALRMSKYRFINGCRLPETLAIYTKLKSYSDIALDMAVIDGSIYREAIRCVFNYSGLKTGLEIDSISGECKVFGFLRQGDVSKETICRIGSSHQTHIFDYFDAKESEAVDFKDFYQPKASGLGGYINMSLQG